MNLSENIVQPLREDGEMLREETDHAGDPVLEIKYLRRCINNLVRVLALPVALRGREPAEILATFADLLMAMLNLDFFYARVALKADESPMEALRVGPLFQTGEASDQIAAMLAEWLEEKGVEPLPAARCHIGRREIAFHRLRLGVEGELGLIVAASERARFREQTERVVLNVAANQLAIGLRQAFVLDEQKRIASELDRRVAERTRELAAINEELRLQVGVLQNLPVSAWTLKPDGTPDFVNQIWLEFSGQTLDFVRSHPEAWMTAIHPEDREAASKAFWNGVRSGQGFAIETRSRRAKDGTYRWHLQQAVVLRDGDGKVLKFVGTTTDIDDQKRAEEALNRARAELARVSRVTFLSGFAACIAHEVNQPLSGIITNASTCLRQLGADPPNVSRARESAKRALRDGNRVSDVITCLRTLFPSKEVKTEPVDINDVAREVIALYLSELQGNHVTLRQEFAEGLPNVMGDRIQLQQVILNLLRNASDAMSGVDDRARELLVSTEPAGEEVHFKVRDAGVGIDPAAEERLFQSFYTTKEDGMGIGLSVSRSIIEAHEGRLWAMANDGPGATFAFSVPCTGVREAAA
jgi:PAS domain S-box-containing protein